MFGDNNLKQALHVAMDKTCTKSRRNFGPLFLTERLSSGIFLGAVVTPLQYFIVGMLIISF